jgi:hypothetical protein
MENPPRKNAAMLNVLLRDFNNQVSSKRIADGFTDI